MQDYQMSKASQDDNYHTTIDDDDLDDTIHFGNPVTQPFLSKSIRVPTTEVGCLSFTQMFQGYLHEYPPPSQADAYSRNGTEVRHVSKSISCTIYKLHDF